MPEIPLYTGGGAPRTSASGIAPRAEDQGLGRAISDAGRQLGGYLQERQDERDKLWSLKQLVDWKNRWAAELKKRDEETDEPEGFTPGVMDTYDVDTDSVLDTAPSDGARQFLELKMTEFRADVYNDALRIETGKDVAIKTKMMADVVQGAANYAMTNPSQGAEAMRMAVSAVRNAGLPSQMRPDAERQAVNQTANSWVQGLAADPKFGPVKTLADLKAGQFDSMLSPSDRRVLQDRLESDIKSAEVAGREEANQERRRFVTWFSDIRAATQQGYQPTAFELERMSDDSIKRLFPDEPEAVEALRRDRDAAFETGKFIGDPTKTLTEKAAELAKMRAKSLENPTAFKEVAQSVAVAEAAFDAEVSELNQDPQAWSQKNPAVKALRESVEQINSQLMSETDPVKIAELERQKAAIQDEWVSQSLKVQEDNGVASPKAASKSMLAQIVERLEQAKPADMPNIIAELRTTYPSNWYRLAGEIQSKLPTKTRWLFQAPDTPTTNLLASAHQMSTDEIMTGLTDPDKQTLRQLQVNDVTMRDFVRAISPTRYGADTAEAAREATLRAAALYMKADGLSANAAWKKALADNLSEYGTSYIDGNPYLIPYKKAGSNDGRAAIEGGAYHAKKNFKVTPNLQLPDGLPGFVGKQITQQQYQDVIRRAGHFVMTGDQSGLALRVHGRPVMAVVGGKPQYVVYTWEDLRRMGRHSTEIKRLGDGLAKNPLAPKPISER